MTCETQTVGPLQLDMDNMAGLQKQVRTKTAARYIAFYHARFVFLKFCENARHHVVRKSCFPFLPATDFSGFEGPVPCQAHLQLCQPLPAVSFLV